MTRDEVSELWMRTGTSVSPYTTASAFCSALERFASAVAAAEREACARVCDDLRQEYLENADTDDFSWDAAENCAAAIRARGET